MERLIPGRVFLALNNRQAHEAKPPPHESFRLNLKAGQGWTRDESQSRLFNIFGK
jgi:hypothetical protein